MKNNIHQLISKIAFKLLVVALFTGFYTAEMSAQTYCSPTYSPQGNSWRISEFAVLEISYDYSISSYTSTDNTSETIILSTATPYTFEITTTGWVGVGVAADFNSDGDFDDTDEILEAPDYIADNPAVYSYTITIPATVSPGNYRLRLWNALANAGDGTPVGSPCGAYSYGTYADFTLTIQSENCEAPTALTLDAIGHNTADISWDASPDEQSGYEWALMADGEDPDTDTPIDDGTVPTGTTTLGLTGLAPETTHDFYLRTDCDADGESIWAGPLEVATTEEPIQTIAIDLDGLNADVIANGVGTMDSSTTNDVDGVNFCFFSEDWKLDASDPDLTVGLPEDGMLESTDITGLEYQMAPFTTPYDGDNSLRISSSGTSETIDFVTPSSHLSLFVLVTSGSGSSIVDVEVNFDDATSQSFTGNTIPDWYGTGLPVEVSGFGRGDLSNNNVETPSGNPKIFRLELAIDAANQSKLVTSVTFTKTTTGGVFNAFAISGEVEACGEATNLALDAVSDTTAELSWDASGNETGGYDWALMLEGEHPDSETPIDTGNVASGENTLIISDMDPETTYDFYLQTNCDAGESSWAGPLTFTTEAPSCAPPTALQMETVLTTSATFSWELSDDDTTIDGYGWAVFETGADPMEDPAVTDGTLPAGVNMADATDLNPETTYDVYVYSNCDEETTSAMEGPVTFTTDILNLEESLLQSFTYHPNPVEHVLHFSHTSTVETIRIVSLSGQVVLELEPKANSGTIDLSGLATSLYFLEISNNTEKAVFRIVKR